MTARRSKLTIIGTGRWPTHLAQILGVHGDLEADPIDIRQRGWQRQLAQSRGSILRVGLRPGASNRNGRLFDALWLATVVARRRCAAYYWIGTDVWDSIQADDQVPSWARRAPHWAGAPWFVDELAPLGVQAEPVWFPTEHRTGADGPPSLPKGPLRVSAYVPGFASDLYGWDFIAATAEALPHVEFAVFGDGSQELVTQSGSVPDNVCRLGEVSSGAAIIETCHVHLRPTAHDAFAGTVREALGAGRYVGFTHPFTGVFEVDRDHPESTIEWLDDLAAVNENGGLAPNVLGSRALEELFGDDRAIEAFVERCSRLIRKERR